MSRSRLLLLLAALGLGAAGWACSEALNPQPLPPSTPDDRNGGEVGAPTVGGSSSGGGGSSGNPAADADAAASKDAAPPPSDAGADGEADDASTGGD